MNGEELDSDLKQLLASYLSERQTDSQVQRETLKTLRHLGNQVSSLTAKVDETYTRVVSIEKDLNFVDRRVEKLEEADEITGVHERDKLLSKLADEKKISEEWKKKFETQSGAWKKWVAGVVAGVLITGIGGVLGWIATRLLSPPPAPRATPALQTGVVGQK